MEFKEDLKKFGDDSELQCVECESKQREIQNLKKILSENESNIKESEKSNLEIREKLDLKLKEIQGLQENYKKIFDHNNREIERLYFEIKKYDKDFRVFEESDSGYIIKNTEDKNIDKSRSFNRGYTLNPDVESRNRSTVDEQNY